MSLPGLPQRPTGPRRSQPDNGALPSVDSLPLPEADSALPSLPSVTPRPREEVSGGEGLPNPYEDDAFSPVTREEQFAEKERQMREAQQRAAQRRSREQAEVREAAAGSREQALPTRSATSPSAGTAVPPPTHTSPDPSEAVETPSKGRRKGKEKKERKPDTYIDEENKKLKPFGGKRVRPGDLDDRKNIRQKRGMVKWVVIALLAILVAVGVKNAVMPVEGITEDGVVEIVEIVTGDTGFPIVRGEAFAKEFMSAYLDTTNPASDSVLGYFYNGSLTPGNTSNRSVSTDFKQEILFGPTVYSARSLTDHSGAYIIGALVQSYSSGNSDVTSAPKWVFFSVNVYYDSDSATMAITPDSPALIPPAEVGAMGDVPAAAALGTGSVDEALGNEVRSVVMGFMEGFAKSTPANHSSLDQYIVNDPDPSLLSGLGSQFEFSGGIDNGVTYTAYPTGDSSEAKILLRVTWADTLSGNSQAAYTSTYVMTLNKSADKWLVSRFQPMLFVKDS